MCLKNYMIIIFLIISINAKSYNKPEKSDAISMDKTEDDPEEKINFSKICQEIRGFTKYNEAQRRFKRAYSTEQFLDHLQGLQF